jgi:hypothetical protein
MGGMMDSVEETINKALAANIESSTMLCGFSKWWQWVGDVSKIQNKKIKIVIFGGD